MRRGAHDVAGLDVRPDIRETGALDERAELSLLDYPRARDVQGPDEGEMGVGLGCDANELPRQDSNL
jgi:hypothetical protein